MEIGDLYGKTRPNEEKYGSKSPQWHRADH